MKISITSDDETARVEIIPMPDPLAPPDEKGDPWFRGECRTEGCHYDSFTDAHQTFITEGDAINDAEYHIEHDHEHAEA